MPWAPKLSVIIKLDQELEILLKNILIKRACTQAYKVNAVLKKNLLKLKFNKL